MNTNLSPENERYLEEIVALGLFPSRGDALDAAVELLKRREEIVGQINAGIEQIERGDVTPLDVEQIKRRVRERLERENQS